MKKKIQPRLDDDMAIVTTRIPYDIYAFIDRRAHRQLRTKSCVLRELIVRALQAEGVVEQTEVA